MPKKRFSPEQIVMLLRQIEVTVGQGKSAQIACRDAGILANLYPTQLQYNLWANSLSSSKLRENNVFGRGGACS